MQAQESFQIALHNILHEPILKAVKGHVHRPVFPRKDLSRPFFTTSNTEKGYSRVNRPNSPTEGALYQKSERDSVSTR